MSRVCVDFEGKAKRVSREDANRQTRTMRLILEKLRTQPGVILSDEVGMGKTYVALGVIAQYLSQYPKSRVLIITPSADLSEKWIKDLERFRGENVRQKVGYTMKPQPERKRRLRDILEAKDKSRIWVLPISVFFHSFRREEKKNFREVAYQLLLKWGGTSPSQRKFLWKRLGGRVRKIPRKKRNIYWNGWRVSSLRNTIRRILRERGEFPLNPETVPEALIKKLRDDLYWYLIRAHIRKFSLIVFDEAHHLRNPNTKRYRLLEGIFQNTFRDMLFLTATPFQLGPDELEHILRLFRLSAEDFSGYMEKESRLVAECARKYKDCVREFERAWRQLMADEKLSICNETSMSSPCLTNFRQAYGRLQNMHSYMQTTLSKWVIRNVKERSYRQPEEGPLSIQSYEQLPFHVLSRLLYEYQRRRRTFGVTQSISLTSSWEAFRVSSVMRGRAVKSSPVGFYRKVMRELVNDNPAHPKLTKLKDIVQKAFQEEEKVLVFTSRLATVKSLKTELNRILEDEVYAFIGLPRQEVDEQLRRLRKRLSAPRDAVMLLFRENYFRQQLLCIPKASEIYESVLKEMDRLKRRHRIGLTGKATSPNWRLLHNICELAIFKNPKRFLPKAEDSPLISYMKKYDGVVESNFKKRLLKKISPQTESKILRRHSCTKVQLLEWIQRILDRESVWDEHADKLCGLKDIEIRERLLISLARISAVPELLGKFIPALKDVKRGQAEKAILKAYKSEQISGRISGFLEYINGLPGEEIKAYIDGLATEDLVARASGKESATDRLRYRYGFNTPFRPYVLVASDVMQEGLDLHRECSRIVHYDLAWNPARLEQRVGRIDRLGSRVDRLLRSEEDEKKARLIIYRHYIPGTFDERMYKVVKDRERWFKFILGNRPEWEYDTEHPIDALLLPERFSEEFRIRLCSK